MRISNVTVTVIAALVTMSGPSLADGLFGIDLSLPHVFGAPAPALAAGIPSMIAIGGALLASGMFKRFRR